MHQFRFNLQRLFNPGDHTDTPSLTHTHTCTYTPDSRISLLFISSNPGDVSKCGHQGAVCGPQGVHTGQLLHTHTHNVNKQMMTQVLTEKKYYNLEGRSKKGSGEAMEGGKGEETIKKKSDGKKKERKLFGTELY